MNINSKEYWEKRFKNGDWTDKKGSYYTRLFAETILSYLPVAADFSGTILDFGCGLGDAIPVYKKAFKNAKFIGMDISEAAIGKCKEKYGSMAVFLSGDHSKMPVADIVIATSVFEHLENDREIANEILKRCKDLFIIVPYKERLVPGHEHVHSYSKKYFSYLGASPGRIFSVKGFTEFGWDLIVGVHLKNLIRPIFGRRMQRRKMRIIFHLINHAKPNNGRKNQIHMF